MNPTPVVLASSIPPQLRGQPLAESTAASLQQRALHSWRQAGCLPISFHSSAELSARPGHQQHLNQLGVHVLCAAQRQCDPDPLPNLLASLTALVAAHPTALLAITNADIIFAPGNGLADALQRLQPDQALVARRTNVPAAADAQAGSIATGNRDIYGFDFFAFHAASLRRALPLIPESLVFGRPWWDLYLPLALLAAGLELRDPGPDLFLHPHHEERWSADQWYRHGQLADQRFPQLLHQQGCEAFALRWARQRRRAIRRWPGLTGLRHRFREQRRALLSQGRWLPLHLANVSDAINMLVDGELKRPPSSAPTR
jgi:hypothetical protein